LCCATQGNWPTRFVAADQVFASFLHRSAFDLIIFCSYLQICNEFERFSKYLPEVKVAVFYGGVHIRKHKDLLKNECPHIVVGTPGRILALAREKDLSLKNVRHFVLDECDKMLESLGNFASTVVNPFNYDGPPFPPSMSLTSMYIRRYAERCPGDLQNDSS